MDHCYFCDREADFYVANGVGRIDSCGLHLVEATGLLPEAPGLHVVSTPSLEPVELGGEG